MKVDVTVDLILGNKKPEVFCIHPEATVFDAIRTMSERNVGALLVVEEGQLKGVISERDYTRKVALHGKSSKHTRVGEIISAPVISASPEHTVEECMRLMTSHRIRHLPVMDGSRVLGVISIGDLVNWIISAQNSTIHQLENYISGQYPG